MSNEPVIFADVDHGEYARYEAGIWRADLNITLFPGDFERLKEGRICPNCHENQPKPFPGICKQLNLGDGEKGCGFDITPDEVNKWLNEHFGGEKWIGPTMSEADEDELFKEQRSRKKREKTTKSGIWVP